MDNGEIVAEQNNGQVSETSTDSTVKVMDYSVDFPTLPATAGSTKPTGAWAARPALTAARNLNVTQVFQLATDERQSKSSKSFGNEEQKRCQQIAASTGTRIELCEAKDGSLTVVVKGSRVKVEEARAKLVRELQTQASREISIPKDHHRNLIGKEGSALRSLEADTNCRIFIPKRDEATDIIKIVGPREGIEKAVAHIQSVSERQSKLAQERIKCPKILYPWVRGPNNEFYDKLVAETGAKINIPPPQSQDDVIVITGEKDGVHKAADAIRAIVLSKEGVVKSVTCQIARAQHRYVVGQQRSGIHEIMRETGVSVDVPAEEENNDTITLRGEPAKLGEAMALVYARASSVITSQIPAATWLHKHLIGPKGATLTQLCPNRTKVQIDFDESGAIFLEGSPEEVKIAQVALTAEVDRLVKEMAIEKIKVHPALHRHVIGRGGSLISKIKEETGVQISIPNEQTNSDEITVEGKKEGVKKAVAEIKTIVAKIENEKSRDIIIEQRLHKMIIGQKGGEIQKLRTLYPTVVFSFPEANKKSDIVNLRGDKSEVDKAFKQMQSITKDLIESNYQQYVPIFKEFHKHIIGKGGANIRKIRDETQTRIDLPEGDSGEDKILVTGKKANVEKAIEQLEKIQNELASIITVEVHIPVKVQSRLLGGGRRVITDIEEECGGVHIKFPSEKSESTVVTVRGPKDDVEKAQALLEKMAKDKQDTHEDTVIAKAEYHRFLIGKGGQKINKIRQQYDVRVMFPRESDTDKETIHLLGKKDDVEKVKKDLEAQVQQLSETVELVVEVDPKYHKHFLVRGAALIKEIQEQNGGVAISFPARGGESTSVSIKGSKQCAESAKTRIEEVVDDLDHQTTISVEIPSQHHRVLLTNRGQKVHEIQSAYNVQIRFPDRRNQIEASEEILSEDADKVTISGRDTKCEAAKEALFALVPISQQVPVPFEMHRFLIGKGGETIRKLMQDNYVNIAVPKDDLKADEITVTGTKDALENAIRAIDEKRVEYEALAEDRRLRSFELVIDVPNVYHQKVIGPRGVTVNGLRTKHYVQISLPKGEEKSDNITIHGHEANARACAEEIEALIADLKAMFTTEVALDARFHPRLIGQRGRNVKKVMEEFGVEITFPRTDENPNQVIISGKNEDAVYDCIDYLRNEEEDYLAEFSEKHQYISQRAQAEPVQQKAQAVQMKGAPWQLTGEDFPEMGGPAPVSGNSGVWGSGRRF